MQFKKMAAIAGSAIMAGLAIASPVLATKVTELGKISDMVTVTDSIPSFPVFVIGNKAQPADVAGAVDIAVKLAANAKTTSSVTSTIAGESVTGGIKIATSGVYLTPYSNPQNVKGIITSSDIPSLLAAGTYSSASGGTYNYKQYLYMLGTSALSGTAGTNFASVVFERPTTENTPRISFKTPTVATYTYKLAFSSPVSLAGVTSTADLKTAIQGTTISMLGKDFVISDCAYTGTSDPISSLTLLGGKNIVTVETGTPKTVTSDSKDYTVTLTGVAAQTSGSTTYYTAIGDINGEPFTLRAGETKYMSDGVTLIAAIKVFQGKTGAADYATVAIGADKITVTSAGTVTKGTVPVSELTSSFTATAASGWSVMQLTYTPQSIAWLTAGGKITDMFASAFDMKFNSIIPDFTDAANRQSITLSPSGYSIMLKYKNAVDAETNMFTVYSSDGSTWYWASAPTTGGQYRDVAFDESSVIRAVDQDYFVIEKGGFSHVMQFISYTPSTYTYTFTDEGSNSITAVGSSAQNFSTADLIVDGNTFKVFLIDNSTAVKSIYVDLNGNGKIGTATVTELSALTPIAGTEYANLMPKLITTGQGGLYFYKGNFSNTSVGAAEYMYANLGFGGIRTIRSAANVTTVSTYNPSTAAWVDETTTLTPAVDGYASATYTKNYIDYTVRAGLKTSAAYNITAKIGTSTSVWYDGPGFVLVEEAQFGGTTHSWIYLPVSWDSTNLRPTIASTTYSDDANYAENSVLGTATQYKAFSTYGTLVDHLTSNLGGSATISYPDVFTYANLYVMTPTGVVSSGGAGGQITTEKILPISLDVVKLDNEPDISTVKTNNDLIIVGGPCINELAAEALGKTYPACGAASGIPENAALVKLVADKFATGKTALIVAGWEAADTDLAARVVQTGFTGATTTQLAASELTITGTVASPSYS